METGMTWRNEWKAISGNIKGLKDAALFLVEYLKVNSSDDLSVIHKQLLPHSLEIFRELENFKNCHHKELPKLAVESLTKFLEKHTNEFKGDIHLSGPDGNRAYLQARITLLTSLCSTFEYYVADRAYHIRVLAERAFLHLQRLIVADGDLRRKWGEAFGRGEPDCEKLGSVHLLHHGIWAFKAYTKEERTDLVFQEPINLSDVERTSEGLVLTEWKKVENEKELNNKIDVAKKQAGLYSCGSLAGIELTNYRYLIMVSTDRVSLPPDLVEKDVTYRLINIAINPSSPSKSKV
jgi:hypothetical protein